MARPVLALAPGLLLLLAASPLSPVHASPSLVPEDETLRRVADFRRLQQLPAAEQDGLRSWFSVPAPPRHCLSSARYPLQVCHRVGETDLVRAALEAAENAWELEVVGLGFDPPRRRGAAGPEEGAVFFFEDLSSLGVQAQVRVRVRGYTTPVDLDPTTARVDCLSQVVLDEQLAPGEELAVTVRHEFNHACQLAMDCLESLGAMEATAIWVEPQLPGGSDRHFRAAIREFQAHPELSPGSGEAGALYGAALLLQFVQERLGGGDPRSIVGLWRATVQEQEVNDPALLEAVVDLAAAQGLTREDLLLEFARWRFFTAQERWPEAEVRLDGRFSLVAETPASFSLTPTLEPLGLSYTDLSLSGRWGDTRLVLRSDSEPPVRFELWLLRDGVLVERIGATGVAGEESEVLAVEGGSLALADRAVLLAARLDEPVEWDQRRSGEAVSFSLEVRPARGVRAETLSIAGDSGAGWADFEPGCSLARGTAGGAWTLLLLVLLPGLSASRRAARRALAGSAARRPPAAASAGWPPPAGSPPG